MATEASSSPRVRPRQLWTTAGHTLAVSFRKVGPSPSYINIPNADPDAKESVISSRCTRENCHGKHAKRSVCMCMCVHACVCVHAFGRERDVTR